MVQESIKSLERGVLPLKVSMWLHQHGIISQRRSIMNETVRKTDRQRVVIYTVTAPPCPSNSLVEKRNWGEKKTWNHKTRGEGLRRGEAIRGGSAETEPSARSNVIVGISGGGVDGGADSRQQLELDYESL